MKNSTIALIAAAILIAAVSATLFFFNPAETQPPTQSPTPPPTQTPTPSQTPSPSQTPTQTPAATPTPTPSPSPTPTPQNQTLTYGFEDGLGDWTPQAHLPQENLDWNITVAGNVSASGNKSVLLYIDGTQDDGTVWIERKLTLEPNTNRHVNVTFSFWSQSESFNTIAVIVGYVGTKNPAVEDDFQILGAANEAEGWKTYSIAADVQTGASGEVYVALGLSVRWETAMTYYIDDITITIN